MSKILFTPYDNTSAKALEGMTAADLEGSKDVGGHGGTLRTNKPFQGKYLFLKPISDPTEARNYRIIGQLAPEIAARWMPRTYGEMTVGGRTYLVMENMRKDPDGRNLDQPADIKLAGRVAGLHNAIVSEKEMAITRNKTKSLATKLWMKLVTAIAPHFLMTKGGVRLFDYFNSRKLLTESIQGLSPEHLRKLLNDLIEMRADLSRCDLAFIGASIALIRQRDGSVKPVLIDPAHIQCSNELDLDVRALVGETAASQVFFECLSSKGENQFRLFKASNDVALLSIIDTVRKALLSEGREKTQS